MKQELNQLADEVREEKRLQYEQMHRIWGKPLPERVESGRALSRLRIRSIDGKRQLIHFELPRDDFAFFSEQQSLRLSHNDPTGNHFIVKFLGLTEYGLSVSCRDCDDLAFSTREKWCLDEDIMDVSHIYLKAIEALGTQEHGREHVFPVLFGEIETGVDQDTYDETLDQLEDGHSGMDDSQIDAVAEALASSPFHLIQGPPGTGKTYTLARLVEQLVTQGDRVLVTGFTHRSIQQALAKIRQVLPADCPVVKISRPTPSDSDEIPVYGNLQESGLAQHDGPYVIGATPFSLFTQRLETAHFETAVIDETSQLTVPAAIMAMMRSERWFFFGDDKQLPPVSLLHQENPAAASVFARLTKQKKATTLNITYRLNSPLCHWPSEQFYCGELRSAFPAHRLAHKQPPTRYAKALAPNPCLLRMEVVSPGAKARNEEEAEHVVEMILSLLASGTDPVEIGVIAPFRSQVACIRRLLRGDRFSNKYADAWKQIVVDTVDRFQGQEREVIFYSFASSDTVFLQKLGHFLLQPARLNVAVTRAKTKVILLHSPELKAFAESQTYGNEVAELFLSLLHAAKLTPCPSY